MTLVALILLILVAAGAVLFVSQARSAKDQRASDPTERMDADSRSLLSPIRRLVNEIEEIATKQDSMTARVVGAEAVNESRRILQQCSQALVARTELKRAGRGKSLAEKEIADLSLRASEAASDEERAVLQSAQDARELELRHYETVVATMNRIDIGIRQAEAALSEMKTRLSVAASSEKAELAEADDLRASIGRLKALSVSYDEADEMLRQ